jgi:hypothetical protein
LKSSAPDTEEPAHKAGFLFLAHRFCKLVPVQKFLGGHQMARIRFVTLGLALALALVATACASMRSVSVGSDPSYPIEVTNQMPHAMTVFWSDGGEPRALGAVSSGRTQQFRIVGNRTSSVSITARDANGTHSVGPFSVTLEPGVIKRVVVR